MSILELQIPHITDDEMPNGRDYLSLIKVLLIVYLCRMALHKERSKLLLICVFTGEELPEDLGARTSL